jgi:hypothetical protein
LLASRYYSRPDGEVPALVFWRLTADGAPLGDPEVLDLPPLAPETQPDRLSLVYAEGRWAVGFEGNGAEGNLRQQWARLYDRDLRPASAWYELPGATQQDTQELARLSHGDRWLGFGLLDGQLRVAPFDDVRMDPSIAQPGFAIDHLLAVGMRSRVAVLTSHGSAFTEPPDELAVVGSGPDFPILGRVSTGLVRTRRSALAALRDLVVIVAADTTDRVLRVEVVVELPRLPRHLLGRQRRPGLPRRLVERQRALGPPRRRRSLTSVGMEATQRAFRYAAFVDAIPIVLVVGLALGCSRSHDPVPGERDAEPPPADASDAGAGDELWVEDTLGWRVRFVCTEECRAPGRDAPPDHPVRCPDGMIPWVGTMISGRVLTLTATCADDGGAWFGWPEFWRPIVCASDAECDRLQHVSTLGEPRCVNGLCQVTEEPLRSFDVSSLCLASVPRPPTALSFPVPPAVAHALELADTYCVSPGDACAVPSECRAP